MSFMFLKNCCYKKSAWLFLSTGATEYFFVSQNIKWFSSFLLSSIIANMLAAILINFQQKFVLVASFQHFAIKFLTKQDFFVHFKSALKSLLSCQRKCDVFLLELYLAIDPSNVASENNSTELSELHMQVQKQPLAFSKYFVR